MVRFVTTSYTHMYENDYIGRPEEPFFHRNPNELSDVGRIVEKWRVHRSMTIDDLVKAANDCNPLYDQRIKKRDYQSFIRGTRRITDIQLRTIARALKTTVHILTHYPPDKVPKSERVDRRKRDVIVVHKPPKQASPKPKPAQAHSDYDPDEAARLLAEKFGKVTRLKH